MTLLAPQMQHPMTGTHEPGLVVLSILIAMVASYAALDLAGRVTAAKGRVQIAWLAGGATAMGIGIWSMHYIAMLAYHLPVAVLYDIPTVLLSLVAAMAASAIALWVASRRRVTLGSLAPGAVAMGSGISAMHYIGMAAMRLPGHARYDVTLVVLSVVIAVAVSFAALWLAFRFRTHRPGRQTVRIGSAVLMGAAISAMHYTAMAAVSYAPSPLPHIGAAIAVTALGAAAVAATTMLVLALAIGTAVADRRLREGARINEYLLRVCASFARELDHGRLVQLITDEATALVRADYGAFFFNVTDPSGRQYSLYSLSGAPKEAFAGFRMPRATPIFEPTFTGRTTVRMGNVRKDPRFGAWGPQPHGHLPVVSYLAVPVVSPSTGVLGGLFFAHKEADQFTAEHERIIEAIAAQAAIALDNARLYQTLREEQARSTAALELARAAERRKDEFLAMVSHELRNPLAPIATALEIQRLHGGQAAMRQRPTIERHVRHLTRLVDDLLDVSRISRGKLDLERQRLDLRVALERALEQASPALRDRRHDVSVDLPPQPLPVDGDPVRLAQVLCNLLTNAARFTEPGGRVTVSASVDDGHVAVQVRDTGVGVTAEHMERIFEPFEQGEARRGAGGLGVGLTLARALMRAHGGTLTVASEGKGLGSTFTARMPLADVTEREPAAESPADEARAEPAPAPPDGTAAAERPGRRVLVVDDNVDAAELLGEMLELEGFHVRVAASGDDALVVVERWRPEAAVLDIRMPGMDGWELCERLRARLGPALRCIALTGFSQPSDRERSRAAGFEVHLVKPVGAEELIAALGAAPVAAAP